MSSEMERMFVEGAARAAYVMAWAKREENPPEGLRQVGWHDRTQEDVSAVEHGIWGERQLQGHRAFHIWPATGDANADTLYLFDDEVDFDRPAPARSFAGQELAKIAPPTPDYAREWAWRLLGALEERNNASLPSICGDAARADCQFLGIDAQGRDKHFYLMGSSRRQKCEPANAREFGSNIALLALGIGVSFSHASFELHVPDWSARWLELEDVSCAG